MSASQIPVPLWKGLDFAWAVFPEVITSLSTPAIPEMVNLQNVNAII